jgi:hypothetical protein
MVLGAIAYFTIAETRKTAEQTREMLARYDKVISRYAYEKTQATDSTVSGAVESTRETAASITAEDVQKFINDLKNQRKKNSMPDNQPGEACRT